MLCDVVVVLAAVEDEDSLLKDAAKSVIAPSEESELESEASSEDIQELISSDSEDGHQDIILDMEYQVEDCGYEDEDDTALSPGEDGSAEELSRASSSAHSSRKSSIASVSRSASGTGSDSRSGSSGYSGSESRSGSLSGSDQSSLSSSGSGGKCSSKSEGRSRSSSGSQKSAESNESGQELFYRLMMGKDGEVNSGEKKRKSGTTDPSSSSEDSTTSEARKDNAVIQASPMSESTVEIAQSLPSPVPMMTRKEDVLLPSPDAGHEPHISGKSPALLDPTTAKTSGWMSTSVVEKMKRNPNRRRVSSGGRGGWKGLPGVQTPSPISSVPAPSGEVSTTHPSYIPANFLTSGMPLNDSSNPMAGGHSMGSSMDTSPSPRASVSEQSIMSVASPGSVTEESSREDNHHSGYDQDVGTDTCASPDPAMTQIPLSGATGPDASPPLTQKGFFKFSSSLREGMDMFYRATGTAAATTTASDDDNSQG